MKNPMMSYELGAPLIKALGLPDNCVSFTLRLEAMQLATVECTYHPRLDASALVAAFAEYELVKREPAPAKEPQVPTAAMDFDAWMRERTQTAHNQYMLRTAGVWAKWPAQ
jgi:hypothetical protein